VRLSSGASQIALSQLHILRRRRRQREERRGQRSRREREGERERRKARQQRREKRERRRDDQASSYSRMMIGTNKKKTYHCAGESDHVVL
jgi:hypothetical protein